MTKFKYLGLIFTQTTSLEPMIAARAVAAQRSWSALQAKLSALQWKDRGTKLALYETYVRSVLLYGSPLWGVQRLDKKLRVGEDLTKDLGNFYRSCMRSILQVKRDIRNSLLYVIAAKHPLAVYITKAIC